jgi:hypothetical protein
MLPDWFSATLQTSQKCGRYVFTRSSAMPQNGLIYRVLIASPSDCIKERSSIPDIIYAWNASHSFHTGVILEPVMWESHVIPQMGARPQEIINNQIVDSCDFLIGAFWTRMGTATGNHVSGTAEEIDRLRLQGKNVLLYFSAAPVMPDSIDLDQYKALSDYKKSIRDQGITFDYASVSDFREMLQKHISSLMAGITNENKKAPDVNEKSDVEMFKSQFESFLRKLQAEWAAERDSEPYSTDGAKYILDSAVDDLLDYQAQIVSDPKNELIPIFQEATKSMKALQRHQVFLDGGKSFKEFWVKGDQAINSLNQLPPILAQ